jgi:hypothetical protein
MVEKGLQDGTIKCCKGQTWFGQQAKKSDLADCLIMTQDFLSSPSSP